MTATFFFCQYVNFSFKVCVWCNRTWFADNLTAFYIFFLCTTQQQTYVITGFTLIQQFAEHFNACNCCFLCWTQTNDFTFVTNFDNTRFYTTCYYCTTTCDREYVFNWHQEWFINWTFWQWDVFVTCFQQSIDCFFTQAIVLFFYCRNS